MQTWPSGQENKATHTIPPPSQTQPLAACRTWRLSSCWRKTWDTWGIFKGWSWVGGAIWVQGTTWVWPNSRANLENMAFLWILITSCFPFSIYQMTVCPFQFSMFSIFQTVSNHPSNESKIQFWFSKSGTDGPHFHPESPRQERTAVSEHGKLEWTVPIVTQNLEIRNRHSVRCNSIRCQKKWQNFRWKMSKRARHAWLVDSQPQGSGRVRKKWSNKKTIGCPRNSVENMKKKYSKPIQSVCNWEPAALLMVKTLNN